VVCWPCGLLPGHQANKPPKPMEHIYRTTKAILFVSLCIWSLLFFLGGGGGQKYKNTKQVLFLLLFLTPPPTKTNNTNTKDCFGDSIYTLHRLRWLVGLVAYCQATRPASHRSLWSIYIESPKQSFVLLLFFFVFVLGGSEITKTTCLFLLFYV
jgi:hypothetical protein